MAILTELTQVGKREQLADFISLIDAADKPVMSIIPKGQSIGNMTMSWQADKYADPVLAGVADGEDVDTFDNAAKDRAVLSVYAQKVRRTAGVGDLAENVSVVAGAPSEMARAIKKRLEEIGRDIEATICSDQETQLEESKDKPYLTRGLGKWCLASAQSVLPVPTAYLTPSASIDATATASFTETILNTLLGSVWSQTGQNRQMRMVVGKSLKQKITAFMRAQAGDSNAAWSVRTFQNDGAGNKITNNITLYEGDFNTVAILPSVFLARDATGDTTSLAKNGRGYIIDPTMLELRYARLPRVVQLEDRGGGPRCLVDAIFALVAKNPLGLAKTAPAAG